jgi:hypothetical protein
MYNTDTSKFEEITPALAAKFAGDPARLSPDELGKRHFVRLEIGEVVTVKGLQFRVGQIAPRKLVLRPLIHLQDA